MPRGDRIGVERRFLGSLVAYQHLGIDLGDGTIVHARPHDFRNPFGGGCIERTSLEEFAAGGPVTPVTAPPAVHPPDEVARRALELVGREGYCPVVDNCEHFATWCATGRRRSRQVEAVVGMAAAVLMWAAAAAARGALGRTRAASG